MRLIIGLLILINILGDPSVFYAQNTPNNDSTVAKYLLIRPTRSMANQLPKPNGVMLINDFREVSKTQTLFKNNNAFAHKCGTQWLVDFWKNETELMDEIAFNGDCEQYEHNSKQITATISEMTNRIERTPPQYMYNLKVSADILPKTVIEKMANEQNIFFIYGMYQHLPTVTIQIVMTNKLPKERSEIAKMEAENKKMGKIKLDSLMSKIDSFSKIENTGRILNPVSGLSAEEVEDVFEVTLKLQKGVDLVKLEQIIHDNGGNIKDKNAAEFYFVQLVSTQKTVGNVRDFIQSKYDFVKDVFEFPNKK
jgi:hypothetical protein